MQSFCVCMGRVVNRLRFLNTCWPMNTSSAKAQCVNKHLSPLNPSFSFSIYECILLYATYKLIYNFITSYSLIPFYFRSNIWSWSLYCFGWQESHDALELIRAPGVNYWLILSTWFLTLTYLMPSFDSYYKATFFVMSFVSLYTFPPAYP